MELTWQGKGRASPVRPATPALREVLGPPEHPLASLCIHSENLAALAALPRLLGPVDLICIDPPFATGSMFSGRASKDSAEALPAYRDAWPGGLDGWLSMMHPRAIALRDALADHGSLYVHVDARTHAVLRLLLDEVFGPENLINDIVWSYRSGGGTKRRFGQKHDNILLYAKTERYLFNADAVRVPYDAIIAEKRRHLFNPAGKVCPDVWEIPRPPNHSAEWTGYATQKPVALLERMILASSLPGAVVLDAFGGSGTTAAAAGALSRRWVLIDESPLAHHVQRKRLGAAYHAARGNPFAVWTAAPPAPRLHPPPALHREGAVLRLTTPDGIDFWSISPVPAAGTPATPLWESGRTGRKTPLETEARCLPPEIPLLVRVVGEDLREAELLLE